MPELPDVELRGRYVTATCLHQAIDAVEVDAPRMLHGLHAGALRAALEGTSFAGTARHGKYLFVLLDSGAWLLLHFGMTGELVYHRKPRGSPRNTRLSIHFARGGALRGVWQRRLGRIGLVDDPGAFVERENLGPDALNHGLTPAAFRHRFRDRRGGTKSALMDQSFLAGIGNIYSDEILFTAGLRHDRTSDSLSAQEVRRLYRALVETLHDAIKYRGSSLSDQQYRDLHGETGEYQNHHQVYGLDGDPCRRCRNPVVKAKVSGRTTYFCEQCQV